MTLTHNTPPYHCPRCGADFASSACLAIHFRAHPECRAYTSLARSLASIGFALCPRCHLALTSRARRHWSCDGFAHETCLTNDERKAALRRPTDIATAKNEETTANPHPYQHRPQTSSLSPELRI